MATRHRRLMTFIKLVLIGWMACSAQSGGAEPSHVGVVLGVDGTAEVSTPSEPQWTSLLFRDHLFLNETIRTHAASKVKILLRNDSIMTLSPNSEMHITEFLVNEQEHRSLVNLVTGKIRLLTTKLFARGSRMEVQTPNSTAGIRGSEEYVSYDPITNRTTTLCVSGQCYFRHRDNPSRYLPIPVGHIAHYNNFQFPTLTRQASIQERQAAIAGTALTAHDPRERNTVKEQAKNQLGPPRMSPQHRRDPETLSPQSNPEPSNSGSPPVTGFVNPTLPSSQAGPAGGPAQSLPLPSPLPRLGGGAAQIPSQPGPLGPQGVITPDTSPALPISIIQLHIIIPNRE